MMLSQWRKILGVVSAALLLLVAILYFTGMIRSAFVDPCAGLPMDVACATYAITPWWLIGVFAPALVAAVLNLMRQRPALLVSGWLLVLVGTTTWRINELYSNSLWGRETTLARAVGYAIFQPEMLCPTGIVMLTALLLLPRRAVSAELRRAPIT